MGSKYVMHYWTINIDNLNVGGPDAVFAGKDNLIEDLFTALSETQRTLKEAEA